MSETVRQICTRAARKIGASNEGRQSPAPYDIEVLADYLIGWYPQALEEGTFGRLNDVYESADYTAEEFDRVRKDAAITVTIPDTIDDAVTGETRVPLDLAPIVVTYPGETGYPQLHLYDATEGDWVRLDGLTLESTAPLSSRSPDGLACVVAMGIMEERGQEPGPATQRSAGRFLAGLSQRNASARRTVDYEYF